MSHHSCRAVHHGHPITVLMGWDRPLQGFFMVIERDDTEQYLYSNLDDEALAAHGGLPPTISPFIDKLAALGLAVPPLMLREVAQDRINNIGNRVVYYDDSGLPGVRE